MIVGPEREFIYEVKLVEVLLGDREGVNAFIILRAAHSLDVIVLPPPRTTRNNTANDDTLHNDIYPSLVRA